MSLASLLDPRLLIFSGFFTLVFTLLLSKQQSISKERFHYQIVKPLFSFDFQKLRPN